MLNALIIFQMRKHLSDGVWGVLLADDRRPKTDDCTILIALITFKGSRWLLVVGRRPKKDGRVG